MVVRLQAEVTLGLRAIWAAPKVTFGALWKSGIDVTRSSRRTRRLTLLGDYLSPAAITP
jgi:hypothetical protein